MSGVGALRHQLPKVIHNLLYSNWTDVDEKFLHDTQENIKRDVIPSYPNCSGRIMIHTYTSKMQLGRVIIGKIISIAITHASKPPINK